MGRNATGQTKSDVLRIRITESLDSRINELMVKFGWTGNKDQFTAFLVGKGLELVDFENDALKGSAERLVSSRLSQETPKDEGYDPIKHGRPLTGIVRDEEEGQSKKDKTG